MLIYLAHAFNGTGNIRIPEGVTVIIYGHKKAGLTPMLAALATQINYENSHIPLESRLRYLKIVKKMPKDKSDQTTKNMFDLVKLKENNPNAANTINFRHDATEKDSDLTYPLVFRSGDMAPNLLFGQSGHATDNASIAAKAILDKLGCPYPLLNLSNRVKSVKELVKVGEEFIVKTKRDHVELHILGCRHTVKQHLLSKFGIKPISKSDSNSVSWNFMRQQLTQSTSSIPVAMKETLTKLSQCYLCIFQFFGIEINGDNGMSWRFFGQNILGSVFKEIQYFINSKLVYNLSNSSIKQQFIGVIADITDLIDVVESTIFEIDPNAWNNLANANIPPQVKLAITEMLKFRSLCLVYLSEIGYVRTSQADQTKSFFHSPIMPNSDGVVNRIRSRANNRRLESLKVSKLASNTEIFTDILTAINLEADRLGEDDSDAGFAKAMAILNQLTMFKTSSLAMKETDGKQKAIYLLRFIYPTISQHRSTKALYRIGDTKTLTNILKVAAKYNISRRQITKPIVLESFETGS